MNLRVDEAAILRKPSTSPVRDYGLAALRIGLGGYWLYEQHWKLPPDFGLHQPRGLMFAFQQSIQYPTLNVYKSFLANVVVPNFHLFGWLVFASEVTIGIMLLFGIFTRGAALLGTLQAANLLISQASTPEGPWIYVAILVANLLVLFTPANRRLSVDGALAPRVKAAAAGGNTIARLLSWLT